MSEATNQEPWAGDGEPVVIPGRDREGENSGTGGTGQEVVQLSEVKKDPGGNDDQ